jgi:hypothetical protein
MNKVKIFCPHCQRYQELVYSKTMWQVNCGNWFCDENSTYVIGFEGLSKTLKKGIWIVGGRIRKPGDDELPPPPKPKVKLEPPPHTWYKFGTNEPKRKMKTPPQEWHLLDINHVPVYAYKNGK